MPWFGRYQERLLSPRVIYWALDQVFWQCSSLHACESYPAGWRLDTSSHHAVPFAFPDFDERVDHKRFGVQVQSDVHRSWRSMIYNYSSCRLSYPDLDKFPAMVAVADQFARLFDDVYVAGLFRKQLPKALLWEGAHTHPQDDRPTSEVYRCPSWSWAKLDTAALLRDVAFDYLGVNLHKGLVDVLDVDIELHDPRNAFGRLKCARLVLHGWVTPFRWRIPRAVEATQESHPLEAFGNDEPFVFTDVLGRDVYTQGIKFDFTTHAYEAQDNAFFIPIEFNLARDQVEGIILRKIETDGQLKYERVGFTALSLGLGNSGASEVVKRFEKLKKDDIILI